MSGDTEIDDLDVSDGASENDYSEHEHEHDLVGKEDDNTDMAEQKYRPDGEENGKNGGSTAIVPKPKLDPKDPLRPRRKKARRACFACQRAHLTCGDERPCQRCIKRGLADACQDGVRKKAKYLHDAPPEALRPVLGPNYSQQSNLRAGHGHPSSVSMSTASSPGLGAFFSQADTSPSYPIFSGQQNSMPPPMQSRLSYASQPSPMSPTFPGQLSRQNSMQPLPVQVSNDAQSNYGGAMFDPSNPALFNFDLEGLNFGNQYGAMEFGMLGHMSSGAAETSPKDMRGSISSQQGMGDVNSYGNGAMFNQNMNNFGSMYTQPQDVMGEYTQTSQMFPVHHGLPHAYAIGTGPTSLHSPSTDASPGPSGAYDSSPTAVSYAQTLPHTHPQGAASRPAKRQDTKSMAGKFGPSTSVLGKRPRDPCSIYDTVHEPYSYTTGFHSLTALIQRRFSPNKTLRIAKSLASIRPSFISCTKTLGRQDLIFMEKCFQRTLFEYEEFMLNCCTPTIVCRRTGEVAAVNKEFTLLTGWRKDVLLGKEANLNVNHGRTGSDAGSGPASMGNSGRAGLTTPRMRPFSMADQQGKDSKPEAVFLAELLDDDSVVEFYEDFAKLAFGDSRGSVTTRCKLLKYQTKEELQMSPEQKHAEMAGGVKAKRERESMPGGIGGMGNRVREIEGEGGIGRLERDGKMDCSYCWMVKRDVFDIPMLIVMNFLPCI